VFADRSQWAVRGNDPGANRAVRQGLEDRRLASPESRWCLPVVRQHKKIAPGGRDSEGAGDFGPPFLRRQRREQLDDDKIRAVDHQDLAWRDDAALSVRSRFRP
jgi:hypothetical protein